MRDRDIDHDRLERGLMDALKDLREIISVTEVHEQRTIHDILFTYCSNLDESPTRADFQIEYDIPEGPEIVLLADLSRQVMRIVEESVANTIKYAQASRLSIRMTVPQGARLEVLIEDNGQSGAAQRDARGDVRRRVAADRRNRPARSAASRRTHRRGLPFRTHAARRAHLLEPAVDDVAGPGLSKRVGRRLFPVGNRCIATG